MIKMKSTFSENNWCHSRFKLQNGIVMEIHPDTRFTLKVFRLIVINFYDKVEWFKVVGIQTTNKSPVSS